MVEDYLPQHDLGRWSGKMVSDKIHENVAYRWRCGGRDLGNAASLPAARNTMKQIGDRAFVSNRGRDGCPGLAGWSARHDDQLLRGFVEAHERSCG